MLRALLYGQSIELTLPVFQLLKDAGFVIDYLSSQKRLSNHPAVENFFSVSGIDSIPYAALKIVTTGQYNLVVAVDDITLDLVKKSKLTSEEKLRILPLIKESHLDHLSSKINLSKLLEMSGIRTPKFQIIHSKDDLINLAPSLYFPLIIKGDVSGGGTQTFKISDHFELMKISNFFQHYPAVLQEYMGGKLIGIEAFYQNQQLIYFNYSEALKTVGGNEFTPSSHRLFHQIGNLDNQLLSELKNLGEALGADGFVNISAIQPNNSGKHYYFEADMRPTVWVNSSKYFGNLASLSVKKYFLSGEFLNKLPSINQSFPIEFEISYPPRVSFYELFSNKFLVWDQLNEDYFLMKILVRNFRHRLLAILNFRKLRKKFSNFYKSFN